MNKNLRVIIFILIICLSPFNSLFAQMKPPPILNDPDYDFDRTLRFGFSLSLHMMDFRVKSNPNQASPLYADVSHLIPGFNVNVISDLRIVPTLHLRFMPGLAFGQRDLSFYQPDGTHIRTMKLESSFIELPLTLKYSATRKTNTRPYIIAGTCFRIDMASYKKLNLEEGIYLRLIKGDFYYEFGFGIDYYLNYFKFATELKFSSGFRNALARATEEGAVYANAIDHLKSQLIIISFHFE